MNDDKNLNDGLEFEDDDSTSFQDDDSISDDKLLEDNISLDEEDFNNENEIDQISQNKENNDYGELGLKDNSSSNLKRRKRIGVVTTRRIVGAVIILMIISFVVIAYDMYKTRMNNAIEINLEQTVVNAKSIQGSYESAYGVLLTSKNMFESTVSNIPIENRSRVNAVDFLERVVKNNNSIYGLGVYFFPNSFDAKDEEFKSAENPLGRFLTWSHMQNDGGNVVTNVAEKTTDYEKEDWYSKPLSSLSLEALAPYKDENNNIKSSLSIPIKSNDLSTGIIRIDINIDTLNYFINSKQMGDSAYSMFLSNDGTVGAISSGGESYQFTKVFENDEDIKNLIKNAINGINGYIITTPSFTGEKSLVSAANINIPETSNDWVYITVEPISIIAGEAIRTVSILLIFYILMIISIAILVHYQIEKRVTKPISHVSMLLDSMARFDYRQSDEKTNKEMLKYLEQEDEVGVIFRAMMQSFVSTRALIEKIQKNSKNTASEAEELTATAQSVSGAASDVSSAVENIAQGASSQAQDIQYSVKKMDDISELLKKSEEIVAQMRGSINMIDDRTKEGDITLEELKEFAEESNKFGNEFSKIVTETVESANKIGTSSEMIQAISDQTNLLALNAAIDIAVVM